MRSNSQSKSTCGTPLLACIALLNIVTGIFVHDAIETARIDHEFSAQVEFVKVLDAAAKLTEAFAPLDADGFGHLTIEPFQNFHQHPDLCHLFGTLHLEGDPVSLFHALDLDEGLDIHDFVMGCLSLRSGAKAVDMAAHMKENRRVTKRIQRMTKVTA